MRTMRTMRNTQDSNSGISIHDIEKYVNNLKLSSRQRERGIRKMLNRTIDNKLEQEGKRQTSKNLNK